MSGADHNLRSMQSNLDVYSSHNPENFQEALNEFSVYCERQLPSTAQLQFIPTCFEISSNDEYIIFGSEHGDIASFDVAANELLQDEEVSPGCQITTLVLVLDNKQLVAVNKASEMYFLDFPSLEVLHKVKIDICPMSMKNGALKNCLYYVNGTDLLTKVTLSAEEDYYPRKFQKTTVHLKTHAFCIETSDDNTLLAVGYANGSVSVLYTNTEQVLKSTPEYQSKPTIISFSRAHQHIAIGYENNVIQVFTLDTKMTLTKTLLKHTDAITGLSFVRDNKYLVSASLDSFINVWDMRVESLPYSMNIEESRITRMKCDSVHQVVYYTQDLLQLTSWNVPQLPRNARYRGHSETITKLLFVPESHDLLSISEDGSAMLWDYRSDDLVEKKEFEGKLLNASISQSGSVVVISSSVPCLYKWNLNTSQVETIPFRNSIEALELSPSGDSIAISDPQSRVIVYSFDTMEQVVTLKGHIFPVTACLFTASENYLITASKDCSIGEWDISTGLRDGNHIGHTSPILAMIMSGDLVVSSEELGTIVVWNLNFTMLYSLTSPEPGPCIGLYLSNEHSFLISLQPHRTTYWQMDNLSLMFQIDTTLPGGSLAVSQEEKFIAVAESNTIYIEENALQSTSIRVVGKSIGSPHKFMKFIIDCQKENSKVGYDMNHNHWAVAPYMFGVSHVLSFCNRFDDLNKALFFQSNRAGFFASVNDETSLSICVEMEYKNCIDICLKYMKNQSLGKQGARNMRAYVPLNLCLAKLNSIEYPYIAKLYDSLFIECNDSYLPRFCLHETELPSLYLSDHMIIYQEELVPVSFFSNSGRPIVFSQSTLSLDLDLGTNASVEFLISLLECSDPEIFRSKLVIEYLNYKWNKVKPAVYVLGFTYVLYLILLAVYIVIFNESEVFLCVLVVVHIALLSYEVLQIATDFNDYWFSIWNVLDQLRSLSFSFYAIMAFQEEYNDDILLAVLIFSWARGISCFRMFDDTRYMVRLIIQVIIDISTFFFILFYATLAFAFVFYLRNPEAQSFAMYVTQAYRLDLGDFETDLSEPFDWVMFFISSLINPLMMLNLLIAIMSDTAAGVAEIDDICGLREMTEMIIDIEKSMFWKKAFTHKHFLHKCDFVQADISETDEKVEEIKIIKKQVSAMRKTIKNIKISADKLALNGIQDNVNSLKVEQDQIKLQMSSNFDSSNELISKISQKLQHR